jgi:hypothetical protein
VILAGVTTAATLVDEHCVAALGDEFGDPFADMFFARSIGRRAILHSDEFDSASSCDRSACGTSIGRGPHQVVDPFVWAEMQLSQRGNRRAWSRAPSWRGTTAGGA